MRIYFITHIINDMDTKRIARALVFTGTIGGVMYVIETIVKVII